MLHPDSHRTRGKWILAWGQVWGWELRAEGQLQIEVSIHAGTNPKKSGDSNYRYLTEMEREGMFTSSTVAQLSSQIFSHLDTRSLPQLSARAQALGIPIKQGYSLERIVFVIAQAIANLLDEVSLEGEHRRGRQGTNEYIEGNSTLNSAANCLTGNLNIAALIFSTFCPRMSMWDILELVATARDQLAQEEEILQDVRLQERLRYPSNLRQTFTCHCLVYGEPLSPPLSAMCSFCKKEFHPECQPSTLFCNCCFLRFCVFDLRESFLDPYSHGKQVQAAYFTYIENLYPHTHAEDNECVYFHIVNFSLPDMNNIEKKEKNFFIKMALVDRIFSGELAPPAPRRGRGRPKDVKSFWLVDGTEYYLYLNHNQIRITNTISECAVIFKVIPRVLLPGSNILVIKCVKRNIRYDYFPEKQENPYLRKKEENKAKIIMMGVYQTNKVRSGKQAKNKQTPIIKDILPDISVDQSLLFIQHILRRVNKIEYQIVDLMDITSREKIINPVRSYSCTHMQCFDFQQYRQKIKPNNYKPKGGMSRKKKAPIDVDALEEQEDNIIDLESHQVIVIDQVQNNPTPIASKPILTPRERRREFLRRKRQRQNFEKDPLFCPICNKRMLSLYTDPLFKSILLNSGFYSKVRIFSNGEYNFQPSPKLVSFSK